MRILLVHQYFLELDDGGGSRFNEMTADWVMKGHEITVLAGMIHANAVEKRPEYKRKYFVRKQQLGVEVIRCHVSEAYNKSFIGRLWGYFSFVFSSIWAGLFKAKGQYDLILVTSPPLFLGITGFILSRFKGIPYVFEVRDLWPESAVDTGVLKNKLIIRFSYWFERFVYRKAQLINVLTPAFRDALIEKGVPKEKIIFIPNAADFSISDAVLASDFNRERFRESMGLTGKQVIIYVGAHGVANHLIQVIETADLIRKELPDVLFLFVGDGMQKPWLQEEARKRDLVNIRFVDPVPKREVFKYILAADFGSSVLKKVDTFKTIYSNKTFDYMACKKPIFMLIDGVSRQLVEDAACGVYVEPESPEHFKKVLKVWTEKDKEMLKEIGESGYSYAKKYFDRKHLANQYLSYLQDLSAKVDVYSPD